MRTLKNHENNFDFLRLIAAVGVLLGHCYLLTGNHYNEHFYKLTGWHLGELCVFAFFLISGYLITASYINKPKTYVINRVLRIVPALFVAVTLTVLILGPLFTKLSLAEYFQSKVTYQYLYNYTILIWDWRLPGVFDNNPEFIVNGSLWTLSSEIMMYATIFIIGSLKLDFHKTVPCVIIFMAVMIALGLNNSNFVTENWGLRVFPDWETSIYFMVGSAFYLFREKISYEPIVLCIVMLVAVALACSGLPYSAMLVGLPYALFYFTFSKHIPLNKSAKYGDFSYGIYIYAFPIQQAVISFTSNSLKPLELFAISLPITVLCAALSWHFVEKQALKFKPKSSRR